MSGVHPQQRGLVAACQNGRVPPELTDLTWPRRTERLSLRPARPEDAPELWSWYRLPEVTQWLSENFTDEERFAEFYADRCSHYLVGEMDGRLVANPARQTRILDVVDDFADVTEPDW